MLRGCRCCKFLSLVGLLPTAWYALWLRQFTTFYFLCFFKKGKLASLGHFGENKAYTEAQDN